MKYGKNDELFPYEVVQDLDSFAGVLNDDTVLIDVDNTDYAYKLLEIVKDVHLGCRVIETSHGLHFVLRRESKTKNAEGVCLACGIADADILCGSKYQVLKLDGIERKVLYDFKNNGKYDILPAGLMSIGKTKLNILG